MCDSVTLRSHMYVKGHLRCVKLISLEHNLVLFYDLKKIHGIIIFITMSF